MMKEIFATVAFSITSQFCFAQGELASSFNQLHGTYKLVDMSYNITSDYLFRNAVESYLKRLGDQAAIEQYELHVKLLEKKFETTGEGYSLNWNYRVPEKVAKQMADKGILCKPEVKIEAVTESQKLDLGGDEPIFGVDGTLVVAENYNGITNFRKTTPGYYWSHEESAEGIWAGTTELSHKNSGTFKTVDKFMKQNELGLYLLGRFAFPKSGLHVYCEYRREY